MTQLPEPTTIADRLRLNYDWTPRQRDVLDLLAKGCSNREIAESLGISLDGAKWHLREILAKLDVESRDEAAEYWRRRNGWTARLVRTFPSTAALGAGRAVAGLAAGLVATGLIVAVVWAVAGGTSPTGGEARTPVDAQPTEIDPGSAATVGPADPLLAAVQAAVEQRNVDDFAALVDFTESECKERGVGPAPQCPAGVPGGSAIPSLAMFVCGEAWISGEDLKSPVDAKLPARYRLFAVAAGGRTLDHFGQPIPVEQWMLFDSPDQPDAPAGLAVALNGSGIVGFGWSCDSRDQLVASVTTGSTGWTVPPSHQSEDVQHD